MVAILRPVPPSELGDTLGIVQLSPLFIWGACTHVPAVNSGFLASFGFSSFWMEGMKPPIYGQWGSLFWWVEVFHIREADWCHHSSWHGGTYPFHSSLFVWPCQLWPSLVSGHIFLWFTICQYQWTLTSFPPLHICVPSEVHSHITLPKVFSHLLWMLQWMSMAEVVTSC